MPSSQPVKKAVAPTARPNTTRRSRRVAGAVCFGLLILAFAPALFALTIHVAHSQLHSYILLVPFISGYLLYIRRDQLQKDFATTVAFGLVAAVVGLAALLVASPGTPIQPLSENDYLGMMTLSFLCFLVAGGFLFLGRNWMAAAAFPVAFLFFLIPMPDVMADGLETASQLASAETASVFFSVSGTPFLRDGTSFNCRTSPST